MLFINFITFSTNLLNYLILINFWNFFFFNSCFFDLLFKLWINDPIIAFYSFFWVNGVTVITFFSFSFLIVFFFNRLGLKRQIALIVILTVYIVELESFFLINHFCFYFNLTTSEINFFLTNSLNKYHPFFLYMSVIALFVVVLGKQQKNLFYKQMNFLSFFVLTLNALSLFLGAWWAAQEGSWGGWWNWDPSETLGLIIFIAGALLLHNPALQKKNRLPANIFVWNVWFFFVLIYFFVQLNFAATSHNFGIKFFFFFSNSVFLLEVINFLVIIIFSLLLLSKFYLFKYKFLNNNTNILNFKKLLIFSLFCQFCLVVNYLSFFTLINFFCYSSLHVVLFAIEATSLLYFFVILFSYAFHSFNFFFYFLILFFNSFLLLLPFFKFKYFVHTMHFFFYVAINEFFLIEKLNYSISLIVSSLNRTHSIFVLNTTQNEFCHLNSNYIEFFNSTQSNYWNSSYFTNLINLYSISNALEQQVVFSVSYFLTHLFTNTDYSFINLFTELKCSNIFFFLISAILIFFIFKI